jgi:hypothetical protein
LRAGIHLKDCAWIRRLGRQEKIEVDMDSGAQVDCVSWKWAKSMDLKPYKKPYPKSIGVVGNLTTQTYGAYWVRHQMTDSQGVTREFYRPFLAIERDSTESPLLIAEPGLEAMRVDIKFRTQREGGPKWNYSLDQKSFIKLESPKKFRKRLRKSPKVYALIEINHLIQSQKEKGDIIPEHL